MTGLVHHMGDKHCPDCGGVFDPVSGYCEKCEGELKLFRVTAYPWEWLKHSHDPPAPAPAAVVSRRMVPAKVAEFLGDPDAHTVIVQRA